MKSVDGDVRLSVGLDINKASVSQVISKIFSLFEKAVDNSAIGRLNKRAFDYMEEKAAETAGEMQESFDSVDFNSEPIDAKLKQLELNFERASSKAQKLKDALDEASTPKQGSDEYEELNAKFEKVKETLQETAILKNKVEAGDPEAISQGKSADELKAKISSLKQEYLSLAAQLNILKATGYGPEEIDAEKVEKLSEAYRDAKLSAEIAGQKLQDYIDKTNDVEEEQSRLQKTFEKVKSAASKMGKVFKTVGKGIGTIKGAFNKVNKAASGFFSKIKKESNHSLKTFLRYVLGMRGVFALIRKLRGYIAESFKGIAKENATFNSSMSAITSSFDAFKNSIGVAIAPLVNVLAPILVDLLDKFTALANKAGEFFAVLTGQKTVTKATKIQKDYAKSLDDTSKSADKASDALGAYDKLQVISSNDTANNSGSSDTGFETVYTDPTNAIGDFANKIKAAWNSGDFTEIGNIIGEKFNEWNRIINSKWEEIQATGVKLGRSAATLFNGIFDSVDWALLGDNIAQGLNTVTQTISSFVDSANWVKYGASLATGLNSLVNGIDVNALAGTITAPFKIAIEGIYGFLYGEDGEGGFNFSNLGQKVGDLINQSFAKINWKHLGKDISGIVKGILNFFLSAIEETDWSEIGKDIGDVINGIFEDLPEILGDLGTAVSDISSSILDLAEGIVTGTDWYTFAKNTVEGIINFFSNIDYGKIMGSGSKLLGAIIGGLAQLAGGIVVGLGESIAQSMSNIYDYFKQEVEDAGGNIIEGITNGIGNKLVDIGKWIKEHIFDPFIEGICDAFIMHSPSKAMEPYGENVILGFINAMLSVDIGATIEKIKTKVINGFTKMKDGVLGVWKKLKEGISSIWDGIKKVMNTVIGGIESMVKRVIDGINWMIRALNGLRIDIPKNAQKWVGFSSIGFNIGELKNISIPRLAEGKVIPPNREFLAMLGDQKSGTNIETPLSTMLKAFNEALDNRGETGRYSGPQIIQLVVGARTIAELVFDEGKRMYRQTKRDPITGKFVKEKA